MRGFRARADDRLPPPGRRRTRCGPPRAAMHSHAGPCATRTWGGGDQQVLAGACTAPSAQTTPARSQAAGPHAGDRRRRAQGKAMGLHTCAPTDAGFAGMLPHGGARTTTKRITPPMTDADQPPSRQRMAKPRRERNPTHWPGSPSGCPLCLLPLTTAIPTSLSHQLHLSSLRATSLKHAHRFICSCARTHPLQSAKRAAAAFFCFVAASSNAKGPRVRHAHK